VPAELDLLLALPGVGGYTARAVAAFAFGQRHPVVDTNVRRLVARALDGRASSGPATTAADLAAVQRLLPVDPTEAARASQAFMELGAVICTAQRPACAACPLQSACRWHRHGPSPATGPATARRSPGYAGTDRQVRGLLLARVRESGAALPLAALDTLWPDPPQRRRALAGLIDDGLVVEVGADHYGLP
jgi:A/G-specific adenine glycosylase